MAGASILGRAVDTAVAVQGTAVGDMHTGDTDLDIAEGIAEGTVLVPAVDIAGDRAVGVVAEGIAVVVLAGREFAGSTGREADISGIGAVEPSTSRFDLL